MHEYHEILGIIPNFLTKYLKVESLQRLKKICYFCGMDYASKDIYNFKYNISRYDHSISTALLTSRFTDDNNEIIAALFHDIGTPVFSHVIDYMNKDFIKQESTEEKNEEIILSDKELVNLLKKDNFNINNIIEFKKYSIVDLERPKLCADRIDGILLSSLSWVKNINLDDVKNIVNSLKVYRNEDNKLEVGTNKNIANKLVYLEEIINNYCNSDYDNYMMNLLSKLTKYIIKLGIIKYDDLYKYDEEYMFKIFDEFAKTDIYFNELYYLFKNIKKNEIELKDFPKIKKRVINPLIDNGTRLY